MNFQDKITKLTTIKPKPLTQRQKNESGFVNEGVSNMNDKTKWRRIFKDKVIHVQ